MAAPDTSLRGSNQEEVRAAWLALAVAESALAPRLARAVHLVRGADPNADRAWTRLCAMVAIERASRVEELPRPEGLLGELIDGVVAARLGRQGAGGEILDEVVGQARIDADEHVLVFALTERGRVRGMSGDITEAASDLAEAAALAARVGLPVAACMAHSGLGMLHAQLGRSADYAAHTRTALEIARVAGDVQGEAHCLSNLGGALSTLAEYAEAERCYDEAGRLAAEHGLTRIEALALAGRAGMAVKRGAQEDGLACYREARRRLEVLGDHYQVVYNELMAARLLLEIGACAPALERLHEAELLAENAALPDLKIRVLETRSFAYEQMGRLEEALSASREALRQERGRLDTRLVAAARASDESQKALIALKRGAWERRRREELEVTERALRAALSEEERLRGLLEETARTDALTGIPNRRAHEADVRAVLADAARTWRGVGMLIVDIDHFKRINDRFGHSVGDEVIVGVAGRLVDAVRAADRVARWGGEEFTVCAPGVDAAGAATVAASIHEAIRSVPFQTRVGPVRVTVSIGVAVHPPGAPDPERTLRLADAALYRAKREGRDRYVLDGAP